MNDFIPAVMGSTPEEYDIAGVRKGCIAKREDGSHTDGSSGTYEWWYFDAHLDGGASLVIVFYTKRSFNVSTGLNPYISYHLVTADGRETEKVYAAKPEEFSAAAESCDVHMGPNFFTGDLGTYTLHFEKDDVTADVTLKATVPSWRPETGHFLFGKKAENVFAWLPSVPEGAVEATITEGGVTKNYSGVGYHDHNWGNTPMKDLMHHWYWGRAKIGDYTVISSDIIAEEKYGYTEFPIFMLAHDGSIIADNSSGRISFLAEDAYMDEVSGKPIHNRLVYDYRDDRQHYRITYLREKNIHTFKMINQLPEEEKETALRRGFDGVYVRFIGSVVLEKLEGDDIVERHEQPALWELMYFGKTI